MAAPSEASRIEHSSYFQIHLPLHYYVWHKNVDGLKLALEADHTRIELQDAHGRTPLMLATVLGHREEALVLLKYGASILNQNEDGFTSLHLALSNPGDVSSTSTLDFSYLQLLYSYESLQKATKFEHFLTTNVASKMATICDYYFEVKSQLYPSLVPLLKLSYYSDTLKVYISNNRIRVDTSVTQIDGWKVVRGNRSYVLTFNEGQIILLAIDHESKRCTRKTFTLSDFDACMKVSDCKIVKKLKKPIEIVTFSPISIQPVSEGWFTKTHKTESLDGLDCVLYDITEALVESQLKRLSTAPLPTELEYFTGIKDLTQVTHSKVEINTFRAWVTTNPAIPLTIEQHVLPILELMSEFGRVRDQRSPHQSWYTKLSDLEEFVEGFPVQLELPLRRGILGLKAKIKFGNVQAQVTAVEGVRLLEDGACEIQDHIFQIPEGYIACQCTVHH